MWTRQSVAASVGKQWLSSQYCRAMMAFRLLQGEPSSRGLGAKMGRQYDLLAVVLTRIVVRCFLLTKQVLLLHASDALAHFPQDALCSRRTHPWKFVVSLKGRKAHSPPEDLRCIQISKANLVPLIRYAYAKVKNTSSHVSTECNFEMSRPAKRLRRADSHTG